MMRLSDKPPSYDELFPPSQEFTKLPEKYLDKLTRDTPCHSTYFSRTCQWGDMVGFYRGELDWKGRRSGEGVMLWSEKGSASKFFDQISDFSCLQIHQVYDGNWEKDLMSGHGEMWWSCTGTSYRGEWSQGQMNGEGTLILEENSDNPGQCFSGIFRKGKNIGAENFFDKGSNKSEDKPRVLSGLKKTFSNILSQ